MKKKTLAFIIVVIVGVMLVTSGPSLPSSPSGDPFNDIMKGFDNFFKGFQNSGNGYKEVANTTPIVLYKVIDSTNSLKSTSTEITTGIPATVYTNSLTFGEKTNPYTLKLENAVPVTYINTQYQLLDPEGALEIIVTDSSGTNKYEGIGRQPGSSGGYDGKLSDEIKLYSYGNYTITLKGYKINANLTINYGK